MARDHGTVEIVINGHHLPGRSFWSDGVLLTNVHVGPQGRRDPVDLVPGDAPSARWQVDVRVETVDGELDFKGPAVHGKRGERFVYLTWGDVGDGGGFAMFRRIKLMLDAVDPDLIRTAERSDTALQATIDLTDDSGGPRCARVGAPALTWAV